MNGKPLSRRELIEKCIVKGLLVAAVPASSTQLLALWQTASTPKPTPRDVLGPFYKKGAPNVKSLHAAGEEGVPLKVTGRVWNSKGEPVQGAQVDIWHADHHGRYDLKGYKYRTKLDLQSATNYELDTIMPGHYEDRPAQHIHYLISAPGCKTLVTQCYFATDPFFDGDPDRNYGKRNIIESRELVKPVMLYERPGAARTAVIFDIVLEKA